MSVDLDINNLCKQFIGVIEKKVKDCEVSNEKWLDNKEIAEKKIRYMIYNILQDIEKHLNAKAEPEGLALFNDLDINKLCKHFIEFIEKKVGDYQVSDVKWFEKREMVDENVGYAIYNILMDTEKYLNLEEMVPYTEDEKIQMLEKYRNTMSSRKNLADWCAACEHTFALKYAHEVLCKGNYDMCYNSLQKYREYIAEKNRQKDSAQQENQVEDFGLDIKYMRKQLELGEKTIYCTLLMNYGDRYTKILSDNLKDFYKSLQYEELCMEKKDELDKEVYTEDYMVYKWESIIYYILIAEGVMVHNVLQKKEKKDVELKLESYTKADIEKICNDYYQKNSEQAKNLIAPKYFYQGIEVCEKFDKRIKIEKEKSDGEQDKFFKISIPIGIEEILKEIILCRVIVEDRKNKSHKLYMYETLRSVLKKIKDIENNKKKPQEQRSMRKIIYDSKIEDYYLSYEIFNRNEKIDGLFSKKCDSAALPYSTLDFESVENWNYYTGQLIINCIWTALTKNKANDFFMLAANNKDDKEKMEQIDKALYWGIEEIIKLIPYFGYVATAYIAERLYSCVGIFAEKIEEDFSVAIKIFTSLALALDRMNITEMYRFWKNCAECDMNNDIKEAVKRILEDNIYYKEIF